MKLKLLISSLSLLVITISFTSHPALARPVFEADGGVLLTGYTAKQVTNYLRGIISSVTTPPPEIPKEIKKQLEPLPGPGQVTLWQSWSPNPDRGVIGPDQRFRLTWSASKNNRGNDPDYCRKHGTWEDPNDYPKSGETFLSLPAGTYEGEHGFGIRCNWGGYWNKAEVIMFLDKPVQAFVSADGGGRTGAPGIKGGGGEIIIPLDEPVRVNFTAIDVQDFQGGLASCLINGEEFRGYVFFDNGAYRQQASYDVNPAKEGTYTLTCGDYFSKGDTDSITVKIGTVCLSPNECSPGQTQCLNNEQYKYCVDTDPGPGTCYKWSASPIYCISGAHCSGNQCIDDKTGEPRMPTGDKTDKVDSPKIDWDKLLKELNKTDTGTDNNGGAGGAGFPTFGSTQCYDGKDNDNDAKIDKEDPGCLDSSSKYNPNDNSEFQYRIKEVIPDFFNLNWFKLDFVNFFQLKTLAQK